MDRKVKPTPKKELVPNFKVHVPPESIALVNEVLKSGWIGGDGPKVKEFEKKIGELIGSTQVLAVNSGTSALHLALRLANVAGGEVITTPMTCFATNAPIVNEGAEIVWADIDPNSGNIDPYDIVKKITRRTRAIMMVHWGGVPADIETINKIGQAFKIPVIEDAAQALGSQYHGKPIGTHSDFVCFSTQAIKIINTSDGGLLVVKKKDDYERAKRLRWYGIDREGRSWDERGFFWEYPIAEAGFKMQMTDLNAALGLGQLGYLSNILTHRRKLAAIYQKALAQSKNLTAQTVLPDTDPNYWMFTVLSKDKQTKLKLWEALNKIFVKAEEGHRRNDSYPVFAKFNLEELAGTVAFDSKHLIIPAGQWVTLQKAQEIAQILINF